jgi:hypothetical protein
MIFLIAGLLLLSTCSKTDKITWIESTLNLAGDSAENDDEGYDQKVLGYSKQHDNSVLNWLL